MNMSIYHADDFTRSHPVLTGKRKGTTLRGRLERIRDTTKKASVRKAAEQWLRERWRHGALSNNLVTNNKCIACTYYKNNDEGDYNYVVKDCGHPYDHAVEQLVIMCCDTCKWSSRPCAELGGAGPACPYGDNYVKAPRFHGLRVYNPLYRTIEGEQENAEAVCPESPSNMVDPVSCKCGCPGCPANDEEEPRDQGKSERSIIVLDLG